MSRLAPLLDGPRLIDDFIGNYGVFAIFLGCFFEGEAVAIAGGVLARNHHFPIWQAVVAVFAGAYISDAMWFFVGRHLGTKPWIARFLTHAKVDGLHRLLNRNPLLLTAMFRFVPGLRIVGPLVLAQSRISAPVYLTIAAVSAAIWAVVYVVLGNWIGAAFVAVFGRSHRADFLVLLAVALVVAGLIWAIWRWRKGD